jgi:hypothetical protein
MEADPQLDVYEDRRGADMDDEDDEEERRKRKEGLVEALYD